MCSFVESPFNQGSRPPRKYKHNKGLGAAHVRSATPGMYRFVAAGLDSEGRSVIKWNWNRTALMIEFDLKETGT